MIPEIAMDYSKKTKEELIVMCREQKKKGYSGKKRDDLIQLLESNQNTVIVPSVAPISVAPISVAQETVNQPASKLRMIDLFAGTGAFTNAFQQTGKVSCVFANDMVEWSKRIYDENYDHKLTLQDLNTVKVEDIPPHDILTGGFPCFVAGTLVLTNTGYKKIEDVTTTDTLLTHTGAFQSIRNLQRKFGVEEVHAINIMFHPHIIQTTSEHPFYVKERMAVWNKSTRRYQYVFSKPNWVTAKDLTTNHYTGMAINTKSIIPTFDTKVVCNQYKENTQSIILDQEDQWFLMGYFLGDGWVQDSCRQDGRHCHKICFSVADKDIEIVSRLQKVLPIADLQKR
jgi:hypothetical protein